MYSSERYSQIGYTTISERLAHDVQHLLLRLGIVGAIRTLRRAVYEGTETSRHGRSASPTAPASKRSLVGFRSSASWPAWSS